jgi:hypothetical protein
MTHHPHARVAGKHTLQPPGSLGSAVRHDYLSGMLAEANPHPAAVMERHPGSPAYSIDQRI